MGAGWAPGGGVQQTAGTGTSSLSDSITIYYNLEIHYCIPRIGVGQSSHPLPVVEVGHNNYN